jgi:hypothetical protein
VAGQAAVARRLLAPAESPQVLAESRPGDGLYLFFSERRTSMTNTRIAFLVLCCVLCVTAFLASAPDVRAQNCKCLGGGLTATLTGAGTDCNAALNNLNSLVVAAAENNCSVEDGTCLGTLTITNACHFHQLDNMWKENGYLSYKCNVCF